MPLVCQKCGHSNGWDSVLVQRTPVPDISASASNRAALAEIQAERRRFKTFSALYLSALEKQGNEVKANLDTVVYPILSLPAEITSRIFVECLPKDGAYLFDRCLPLLLLRVCRRWKDIALSISQLWSFVRIESFWPNKFMVSPGTPLQLQTWFSRAGERPLSLIINHRQTYGTKEVEALDQLDLVWRRYSRANFDLRGFASNTLSTLHIFSDHGFSSAEFIGILQSFPSLSDLACPVKPEANNHPAPLTFTKLLSLRLVSAWKFDYPSIHALELLALPNLGTLVCRASLNPDVISPVLSRSACVIRELRCDFSRDAADMYISQSLQIFPSVETMGIIVYDIASCLSALELDSDEATLSPPILPKLRHITITCKREIGYWDCRHFIKIVYERRAHPDTAELKSLHIFGPNPTAYSVDQDMDDDIEAELCSLIEGGLDFTIDGTPSWSYVFSDAF
ncbi:hypothetical protein C8R45DRAFT_1224673 [Mycena sanguinolenta]|nr:hypothetical protein C8R45DRAFT_1224673 [Mycena sanguinolenta]